jgi:3'-phosphoadenosine 5'-phosphosulfate sulfotransferase (PAPS reductase)/FAD synthetase
MTYEELKYRQSWTLEQKIDHTIGTVEFFLSKTEGKAAISFSGGKDSTVMLDIYLFGRKLMFRHIKLDWQ